VDGWRVRHNNHVVALRAGESELGDRLVRGGQQALSVALVRPCARDDLGAVLRSHVLLVELDDSIDRVRRHKPPLGKQRL